MEEILSDISQYYTTKLSEHGETPRGVDWNGVESQTVRFEQLCKVIDKSSQFSINDLGCGYGAFYEYLAKKYNQFTYTGVDISRSMIEAANSHYSDKLNTNFIITSNLDVEAEYSAASGVFNVRLDKNDDEWEEYLKANLDMLNKSSSKGFAFNCLTSYSDEEKKRDYLYYANPLKVFDFCKKHYSICCPNP